MSSTWRVFKLGFIGMWRNGWLTLTSISVMLVVLVTVSVFVILATSFNEAIKSLEQKLDFVIYVDTEAEEIDVLAFRDEIASHELVESVVYISKEDGLRDYLKVLFGTSFIDDDSQGVNIFEDEELNSQIGNPLPYTFIIQAYDPQRLPDLRDVFVERDLVASYDYSQDTIDRINRGAEVIRLVGVGAIIFLILVSISVILNTMRLAIYNRRQEIEIMKLVGATNWFVQWPFIFEGMYDGILAGLFSTSILYVAFEYFSGPLKNVSNLLEVPLFEFTVLQLVIAALGQIVLGMLLGGLGSFIAVRKHIGV